MAKKYSVAVIGRTGKGAYGHGLDVVWKDFDNVEIVAVADENEKGRAEAVERLGAKKGYASFKEMLEKEKPQIVSVADRFLDMHRDMVLACAEAGCHIFLEKPMARTLEEADEMVTACERHHVKLAIAHQTRLSPRLQHVRKMIADGMLGDLLELRGRGKEGKKDGRGGGQDLMVLGTHILDLMRFLAGDARWCYSRIMQNGKPATKDDVREGGEGMGPLVGDHIFATYGFDNGLVGTFATLKANHGEGSRFGLHVYGSKGIVQLTTGSLGEAFFLDEPSWVQARTGKAWQPISSEGIGKPEPLKDKSLHPGNVLIVKDLLEAIEKDRQPQSSIYDGRAALEMIVAAYESHRLKAPVELPLKNRKHPLSTNT